MLIGERIRRVGRWMAGLLAALLLHGAAHADVPGWQETDWPLAEGVPSSITSIARTPDGYLWIGTWTGLYRFDGFTFKRIQREPAGYPKSEKVAALLVSSSGDLWVGLDWGGVAVVRDGRYLPVGQKVDGSTVRILVEGRDHRIRAVANDADSVRLWTLSGNRWNIQRIYRPLAGMIDGAAMGRDGTLWMTAGGVLALPPGAGTVIMAERTPRVSALALAPDGSVWVADAHGIQSIALDGRRRIVTRGAPVALPPIEGKQRILFDGADSFWRLSQQFGIERFVLRGGKAIASAPPSRMSIATALDPAASTLDAEGLLWVGGTNGLKQMRRVSFHALPRAPAGMGYPANFMVLRDGRGEVYLREGSQLSRVTRSGPVRVGILPQRQFEMPCASRAGGVWYRDTGGRFTRIDGPAPRRMAPTPWFERAQASPTCAEDIAGRLWFSNEAGVLATIDEHGFRFVDLKRDRGYIAHQLALDPQGRMLAYVGGGWLWRHQGEALRTLWRDVTSNIGFIESIYRDGDAVYLGGDSGLARISGSELRFVSSKAQPVLSFLSGIVRDGDKVWMLNSRGLIRVDAARFDALFHGAAPLGDYELFDLNDGLPGGAPYNNQTNLVLDRWNRLWIATFGGIAYHDAAERIRNRFRPPLRIDYLRIDGRSLPPGPDLAVPPGTLRIAIGYAALSLAQPGRNRFRYRLIGVDRDWIEAGNAREAVYTGLGPGSYRFEVIGSNNDGVWNNNPAVLGFRVTPALHQTWWFFLSALAAGAAAVFVMLRVRERFLVQRVRMRLEERARERDRIARELHDTLLQNVHGLSLGVQAVVNRLPREETGRAALEQLLAQTDETIIDARNRIAALRPGRELSGFDAFLEDVLSFAIEIGLPPPEIVVQGEVRDIDPGAAYELRSVVREALRNVARHADASSVAIRVGFGRNRFDLTIEDDGVGLPVEVARAGCKPGHFGLISIRERVERIGGNVEIASPASGGTRVTIRLPARAAFADAPARRRAWLAWFGGSPFRRAR